MNNTSNKKEMKILTIGAPKFSALSKEDYKTFISCLEFQIRDFYKDKKPKNTNIAKTDKNL